MLHGWAVTLYQKAPTGTNGIGETVYDWYAESVTVENVLIGEPTADERADELTLYGKRIAYTLGIPKADAHDWENQIVEFFGKKFRTYGMTVEGIESNIPLLWHKKVKCERIDYE